MKKQDIAKLAGVSPSTVSLVLNGKAGVSNEVRSKILSLAKEHQIHYHIPQEQEKSIVLLKYFSHGMIVEENDGFILSIIEQVERECRRNLYCFKLHSFSKETLADAISFYTASPPSGIVVLGSEIEDRDIEQLLSIPCPKLILDSKMDTTAASSVLMANEDIVAAAMDHLYQLGHRKIGFVSSSIKSSNFTLRRSAYTRILRQLGMDDASSLVFTAAPTLGRSYEDMLYMLKNAEHLPTAFLAANDILAIGTIRALQELGIRVPEDISVVGIDDIPYSAITVPPLTTMRISRTSLGSAAFSLLSTLIDDPEFPNTCIQIAGKLVLRSSTAPPRSDDGGAQ